MNFLPIIVWIANDREPAMTKPETVLTDIEWFEYALVIFADKTRLVTEFGALPDILPFEDYLCVTHVTMTKEQFEALPEFES